MYVFIIICKQISELHGPFNILRVPRAQETMSDIY